jgi:NAD(P)-dependent dehydrogenase (short-subunit alcohol dehydrogenase family)
VPEKIALVTGSSSGIGLLTTVELARAGFRVVASMRDLGRRERLDEAAAAAGVTDRVDVRRLDVTEFDRIPEFIAQIERDYGRLDVLVNNAGFAAAGFAEDLLLEELRQQFETNFFGHVAITKAVLPIMRRQHAGHIIMVSSIGGRVSAPVIGAYDSSKFALEGWSESLRIETRSLGIRVVLVEPGSFQTDIWERNVRVGSYALDRSSPNHERGARFSEVVKKVRKADPLPVAKLIARIAQNPNPRLRYRVGFDAHLQFWLHSLLPWKMYEKVVIRATKIG